MDLLPRVSCCLSPLNPPACSPNGHICPPCNICHLPLHRSAMRLVHDLHPSMTTFEEISCAQVCRLISRLLQIWEQFSRMTSLPQRMTRHRLSSDPNKLTKKKCTFPIRCLFVFLGVQNLAGRGIFWAQTFRLEALNRLLSFARNILFKLAVEIYQTFTLAWLGLSLTNLEKPQESSKMSAAKPSLDLACSLQQIDRWIVFGPLW